MPMNGNITRMSENAYKLIFKKHNLKEINSQDEHDNLQSGAITQKPQSICLGSTSQQ